MSERTAAILGVGHMGRSALAILLRQRPELTFVVLDRDTAALEAALALDPKRVEPRQADLSVGQLDFSGCAAVLNLAGPFFTGSDQAARAAIAQGVHYVDVADDAETTEAVLRLDEEAQRAGVTLLTGAGLSPGVSNWMAASLLEQHAECDGVQVAWVTHEPTPGGLAPLRHMLHMTVNRCPVWKDGELTSSPGFVPDTAASFLFPEPLGEVEAFDTAHPEPITLPRRFPHLRYAGCKGALRPDWANAAFATLGRIGFGYHDIELDIDGHKVSPTHVLWELLWERHRRRGNRDGHALTAVRVGVLQEGEEIAAHAIIDEGGDMSRGTGIGAAVALDMLLRTDAPTGANGVEVLDHEAALAKFFEIAESLSAYPGGRHECGPAISR